MLIFEQFCSQLALFRADQFLERSQSTDRGTMQPGAASWGTTTGIGFPCFEVPDRIIPLQNNPITIYVYLADSLPFALFGSIALSEKDWLT